VPVCVSGADDVVVVGLVGIFKSDAFAVGSRAAERRTCFNPAKEVSEKPSEINFTGSSISTHSKESTRSWNLDAISLSGSRPLFVLKIPLCSTTLTAFLQQFEQQYY